jgi:lysophospholipase L1-like esterase
LRRFGALLAVLAFLAACGSATSATAPATAKPTDGSTPAPQSDAPQTAPPTRTDGPTPGPAATFPAGPLTIATLGDSLTEGQGDDSGLGYTGRLKVLVDAVRPGTKIANVGHSGWSSTDLVNVQNGEPSELTQAIAANPTVALVWIGSNDLWYLYEFGPEPMTTEAEQQDLATYEANIDKILHELTSRGIAVYVALLDDQSKRPVVANPPNPAEPAFPATTAADLVRMSIQVRAYNDVIRRKAAEYHATTVDFSDTTIFTDTATLSGDGNHPNGPGYDKIARIWLAALRLAL